MSQYSNVMLDEYSSKLSGATAEPGLENTYELFSDLCVQIHEHQKSLEHKLSHVDQQIKAADQARQLGRRTKEQLKHAVLSLISQLPVGIICLDYRGLVAEVNDAAEILFEIDIKGRLWREVIQDAFAPKADDGFEISLRNGRIVTIKTQSLGKELAENLGVGQMLILDDVTQTREFQANRARNARLSELGKMSASLAHQIRTPLSTAILYANHLTKYDMSYDKRRNSSTKLLSQLTHIEKQIRDMLFYIRGDIPAQDQASLRELLDQAIGSMIYDLEQMGVRLLTRLDVPDRILNCHRDTLVGAFSNLICNAVDVSDPRGSVTLESNVIEEQWFVRVIDHGPGISKEDQKKLFTPFFSTKKNGNGLGIATAKAIIESHGGNIQISSEMGTGTCVTVVLPL